MAAKDRIMGALLVLKAGNQNTIGLAPGASLQVPADRFSVEDPTITTKRLLFNVAGVTAATDRTATLADGSGLLALRQMTRADAVVSLGNTTAATNIFATTGDELTVIAGQQYRFRLVWDATTGATSTTISFLFSASGTATFTTVKYVSLGIDAASVTAAAPVMNSGNVATAVVVAAAGTGVNKRLWIEGEFEVNAAGTVIPQIKFSADPTGTCQTNVGSFFEAWACGANPVLSTGAWS